MLCKEFRQGNKLSHSLTLGVLFTPYLLYTKYLCQNVCRCAVFVVVPPVQGLGESQPVTGSFVRLDFPPCRFSAPLLIWSDHHYVTGSFINSALKIHSYDLASIFAAVWKRDECVLLDLRVLFDCFVCCLEGTPQEKKSN